MRRIVLGVTVTAFAAFAGLRCDSSCLAACGAPVRMSVKHATGDPVRDYFGTVTVGGLTVTVSCPPEAGSAPLSNRVGCDEDGALTLHGSGAPETVQVDIRSGNSLFVGSVPLTYVETGREVCGSKCTSASFDVTIGP